VDVDEWARQGDVAGRLSADPGARPESLLVAVDTGDRIHYLDWGAPDETARPLPALLLVHGLGQTSWSWAPVARRLYRHARVLVPDLRGHGLSEAPRTGYGLESLAYDLLTVLVANGIGDEEGKRPAVVAGHGFGAIVAAVIAAVRPSAVGGVALVDGGWEEIGESTGQLPADLLRGLGDPPEVTRSMEAFLADRRDYDPLTWDTDQERAARATVDEKPAGHVGYVARPHVLKASVEAMFEYRPLATLPTLDVPLLVAIAEAGTADDEIARERLLALSDVLDGRRRDGAPPTRVVRFPGAGHNLMRYAPDRLSGELLDLLSVAVPGAPTRRGASQ
jgi:pimeloyl-ACP methyl ester carboxylesterase